MTKRHLASMTTREAELAFAQNPVVLVPMGSLEEHGPHAPMGDYRAAERIALTIAEHTDSLVVPALPFGYAAMHQASPGTISLRPQTLTLLLEDVVNELMRYGLDHILFVNGHGGNNFMIEHVARGVRERHGIVLAMMFLWAYPDEFYAQVYGRPDFAVGHGSEPMTSIAMHLFPEEMRMDLVTPGVAGSYEGLPIYFTQAAFQDGKIWIYTGFHDEAPGGVVGDPFLGSPERGERFIRRTVEYGVAFCRKFKEMSTRVPRPSPREA